MGIVDIVMDIDYRWLIFAFIVAAGLVLVGFVGIILETITAWWNKRDDR